MEQYLSKIKYLGYEGINIDRFDIRTLQNLIDFMRKYYYNNPKFEYLEEELANQDKITLEEAKKESKQLMEKFFTLHKTPILQQGTIQANLPFLQNSPTADVFYSKVSYLLKHVEPFNIDINLINGHAMTGQLVKNLVIIPGQEYIADRPIYFSHIEIGRELNPLSIGTIAHEISHTEQERNPGYTRDLLHKEVLSIFIEKLIVQEKDPSGKLLNLSERMRFLDLFSRFSSMYVDSCNFSLEQQIDNLTYIKSILLAEKLFDMYQQDNNKDKYIYDIQEVFNGHKTIEDILCSRKINIRNSQDIEVLSRHI